MAEPNKIEKFKTLETDFGTTIAEALWKRAAQHINYFNKCYPIGMLMLFHETQPNLPATPDTRFWKLADGTAVVNANSVLNGVVLPDLRDQFLRHPATGEVVLSTGGVSTVNLAHNHGGLTGVTDNRGAFNMDGGDERSAAAPHAHTIASDLGVVSTLPLFIALKVYVRIV